MPMCENSVDDDLCPRNSRRHPGGRLPVKEASSQETPYGRYITSDGWFVLNLADALAVRNDEKGGAVYPLESREAPFGDFGVNVRVLWPGQPNALYHAESGQEGFLVLAGECTLIVNGKERPLRTWDFVHSPAGTEHVIVGAGDGPAIVLAVGARHETESLHYPASDLAAKYGASAEVDTPDPGEAYARFERPQPGRPEYWNQLPWA
jgi:uncharacterized cupin superfamily protein